MRRKIRLRDPETPSRQPHGGQGPRVVVVQLCTQHQEGWQEMLAAGRGAELQAQPFKGVPTYIITVEDPFSAGTDLPSRFGANDLDDALSKGRQFSTEAGEIRAELDGAEVRVWSGILDPAVGPRLDSIVARFQDGARIA